MKSTSLILQCLTALGLAATASAQVEVTVTGSTAFRSITIDRGASLFDSGYTAVTNDPTTGLITFRGKMSASAPSLGTTPVTLRLSFSGSAAGMQSVLAQSPISTGESPGVNTNKVPDLALSDVFPESATPPLQSSSFDHAIVGVIPFVFCANNALGLTNITREQAQLLMTSSGVATNGSQLINGMPATYLGGSSTNPVFLVSRDAGSGTRITVQADIGFLGIPTLWATTASGAYILTNGYSSGGLVRGVIAAKSDAAGYLGVADYAAISSSATALNYEGVAFSHAAVNKGGYPLWGYEHLVNRSGGLSANQTAVRTALISAITNPTYQETNPSYTNSFSSFSDMQVERGADGGIITSLKF